MPEPDTAQAPGEPPIFGERPTEFVVRDAFVLGAAPLALAGLAGALGLVPLAFGLLGYLMRKSGFAPAPMVLGLILGPICEQGFRQSVVLAEGPVILHILGSPISLVLAALTLISIASAVYLELARIRTARSET